MNIYKGFGYGVKTYGKALNMVFSRQLGLFLIFPLLLNILIFVVGYNVIVGLTDGLKIYVDTYISGIDYDFINNETFKNGLIIFIKILLRISYFLVFTLFGGYIVLAIMSPVFSYLSERTEKILCGNDYPFSFLQLLKDVVRGVLIVVRNIFLELFIGIILFLMSFIPLVGLVTPILLFIVSSYFYGFSFLDYSIERKNLGVKNSVKYMKNNKGIVIGNGLPFALFLVIPFCGVLFSVFVAIVSVVAGTIAVNEYSKENI